MNIIKEEKYLNYNIVEYDVVNSTMSVVKNYPINSVVIAKQQTSGKGKGDRVWSSEVSNNLYFSLIIDASKKNLDYSQMSFISSVAMNYAIKKFYQGLDKNFILSKWPNDILVNNKKTTGILLEFDNNKLVIGIGINIDFFPKNNVNFNATCLKDEGIFVEKYDLLKEFLANLNYLIHEWENCGFSSIRVKWLKSCYKLGQEIKVNDKTGIFDGIDKDGTLILKLSDNTYYYVKSGDVF